MAESEVERMRRLIANLTSSGAVHRDTRDAPNATGSTAFATVPESLPASPDAPVFASSDMSHIDNRRAPAGMRKAPATIIWTSGEDTGNLEVPAAVARTFGKSGRTFSSLADMKASIEAHSESAAFSRIAKLLDRRDYCTSELFDKLAIDGYPPEVSHAAVDRATRCGLVDDQRYAEGFVAAKRRQGWGMLRIERALEDKGLDSSIVRGDDVPSLSEDDEFDRACAILARRPVPQKDAMPRLARYLANKGFDYAIAMRASRHRVESAMSDCS